MHLAWVLNLQRLSVHRGLQPLPSHRDWSRYLHANVGGFPISLTMRSSAMTSIFSWSKFKMMGRCRSNSPPITLVNNVQSTGDASLCFSISAQILEMAARWLPRSLTNRSTIFISTLLQWLVPGHGTMSNLCVEDSIIRSCQFINHRRLSMVDGEEKLCLFSL